MNKLYSKSRDDQIMCMFIMLCTPTSFAGMAEVFQHILLGVLLLNVYQLYSTKHNELVQLNWVSVHFGVAGDFPMCRRTLTNEIQPDE